MKHFIYADNAATTRLDKEALETMLPWLSNEYGNPSQPYSFARKPKKAIKEAREIVAEAINAEPEEIYFTSGGTESDNWAIKSAVQSNLQKNLIIVSSIEHHAILNACESIKAEGRPVAFVHPDSNGFISKNALEKVITDKTKLVSVMYSNNEIGTIEPIKELCDIAHLNGALFHTDAVQAVGHTHIDVKKLGVDMLSASAHKFNGPKGVGFLFVKRGIEIQPFNSGGGQERGLRAGTENVAGIVGMATALKNNCRDIESNIRYIKSLEERLVQGLDKIDYMRNGDLNNHIPGNISLSFRNIEGEAILHRLDLKGIMISTGSACDSINTQISHVIKEIKVPDDYAKGTIRISLGKDNTIEDVDTIVKEITNVVNGLG